MKGDFDVIDLFDSRLLQNKLPTNDVSHLNCSYDFCPKEANAGGTMIY